MCMYTSWRDHIPVWSDVAVVSHYGRAVELSIAMLIDAVDGKVEVVRPIRVRVPHNSRNHETDARVSAQAIWCHLLDRRVRLKIIEL